MSAKWEFIIHAIVPACIFFTVGHETYPCRGSTWPPVFRPQTFVLHLTYMLQLCGKSFFLFLASLREYSVRNPLLTKDIRRPVAQFSLLWVKRICSTVNRIFSLPQLLFSEIWIMLKSFSERHRILGQSQLGESAVWEKLKKYKNYISGDNRT